MANITWTDWPWVLLPKLPSYEYRHTQDGAIDNFLNECDEVGSPLTNLSGLSSIPEEEMESETGHMPTAQAWVPTLSPIPEDEMDSEMGNMTTAQARDQAWVPTK